MMMKKIIVMTGLVFCMIGVSAEEQRVAANFTALEGNKVNSQYMPRPTFATTRSIQGGSATILEFEMQNYGNKVSKFGVATEFVDENIEAINKYLKWAAMAKERGDLLDKDIATIKGYDVGPFYEWNAYQFHSGNQSSHYLIITQKTKFLSFFQADKDAESLVLDEENANRLIKMLLEFKEGKISKSKVDDYQ